MDHLFPHPRDDIIIDRTDKMCSYLIRIMIVYHTSNVLVTKPDKGSTFSFTLS